jgi:uncharacterized protein (DUF488 family)
VTVIYTIGHSVRTLEELVALLRREGVAHVADVRAHPGSRRYPHFHRDALAASLPGFGIAYSHHPDLGGRRRGSKESPNGAWRNASFRAYADYMATDEFQTALDALIALGRTTAVAIMCAEAVPWRCHRWLVSDSLVARDIEVRHILDSRSQLHHLTNFAAIRDGRVTYPSTGTGDGQEELFG